MSLSDEKMRIISCVGYRALAVVTPINTLVKKHMADKQAAVSLLYTENKISQGEAGKSKKWLEREFRNIKVETMLFRQGKDFVDELAAKKENLYFNVNPGMNWQIAFLGVYLPEHTKCFSSDLEYMYEWNLIDDLSTSKKTELLSLGMNSYVELSLDIDEIRPISKVKSSFSQIVKDCLDWSEIKTGFNIFKKSVSGEKDTINKRLIWVKELKGNLYLLFDLHRSGNEKLREIFRKITEVFDPVHYYVTIVTDDEWIIKRAETEGCDYIDTSEVDSFDYEDIIKNWINAEKHSPPKGLLPRAIDNYSIESKKPDKSESLLFVCLGDNIAPTLTAIHSHDTDGVVLFYDAISKRISYLANNIKQVLSSKNIYFYPTDHRGAWVLTTISELASESRACWFNISPGVKTESLALTAGARKEKLLHKVYSIDKEEIKNIVDSSVLCSAIPPDISEQIACHIAPGRERDKEIIYNDDLWSDILEGLSNGSIIPASSMAALPYKNGGKVFVVEGESVIFNGRHWILDKSFKKTGTWWEAVVAKAIVDKLKVDVHFQAKWDWITDKPPGDYTEFDLVFLYENTVIVISCKAGNNKKVIEEETYLVMSEAKKRFGRISFLAFLAIPYEKLNGHDMANKTINKVKILTPKILVSEDKIKENIKALRDELKTTASKSSAAKLENQDSVNSKIGL